MFCTTHLLILPSDFNLQPGSNLVSKKWTFPKSLKLAQGEWTNDTKKKTNIYSRAEAVRVVEQSGKSVTQVAREMGLTTSALAKWVLLADVEIVVTFKLANINSKRLEALLHRFFSSV
jgi:hypothetical protein